MYIVVAVGALFSLFMSFWVALILSTGLVERVAYKTRRDPDPQYKCETTAQYVWLKTESKRHLIGGTLSSFVVIGFTAVANIALAAVETVMLVLIGSFCLIEQHRRLLEHPKTVEELNDANVHWRDY